MRVAASRAVAVVGAAAMDEASSIAGGRRGPCEGRPTFTDVRYTPTGGFTAALPILPSPHL